MLDKRTPDKRTHRISEPFFISQYQFPNFLHCKTNKHRISESWISEPHGINKPFFISQFPNFFNCKANKHQISKPWISESHRINGPFFISQMYPNPYLSERFQKKNEKKRFCKEIKERRRVGSKEITQC